MTNKAKICVGLGAFLLLAAVWVVDFPGIADSTPDQISKFVGQSAASCRVYSLGGFIDREYLWRIDAKPEAIASVIAGLELGESPTIPNQFWRMPPYYWPRVYRPEMKAYRSSYFYDDSRGSDGDHYFLLHDTQKNRAYVWFRNNF